MKPCIWMRSASKNSSITRKQLIKDLVELENNPRLKSSELRRNILNHLIQEFINISKNKEFDFRRDATIIEFYRVIRKIPHYFIMNWSTINCFKRKQINCYVKAFVESTAAFHFWLKDFNLDRIVKNVIEFSWIYFPLSKWNNLLNKLSSEAGEDMIDFLKWQEDYLETRNNHSNSKIISSVK